MKRAQDATIYIKHIGLSSINNAARAGIAISPIPPPISKIEAALYKD